jgi:hypothetical protein
MTPSAKVRAIRELGRQSREAAASSTTAPAVEAELRLRPLIVKALARSKSADPGDVVAAVLARVPVDRREAALEIAVRMCCYVVSEQADGLVPDGIPTEF